METNRRDDLVRVGPPERIFTTLLMAFVALATNSVSPSHDEVRANVERFGDSYFQAFLSHCMKRVYGHEPRDRSWSP